MSIPRTGTIVSSATNEEVQNQEKLKQLKTWDSRSPKPNDENWNKRNAEYSRIEPKPVGI